MQTVKNRFGSQFFIQINLKKCENLAEILTIIKAKVFQKTPFPFFILFYCKEQPNKYVSIVKETLGSIIYTRNIHSKQKPQHSMISYEMPKASELLNKIILIWQNSKEPQLNGNSNMVPGRDLKYKNSIIQESQILHQYRSEDSKQVIGYSLNFQVQSIQEEFKASDPNNSLILRLSFLEREEEQEIIVYQNEEEQKTNLIEQDFKNPEQVLNNYIGKILIGDQLDHYIDDFEELKEENVQQNQLFIEENDENFLSLCFFLIRNETSEELLQNLWLIQQVEQLDENSNPQLFPGQLTFAQHDNCSCWGISRKASICLSSSKQCLEYQRVFYRDSLGFIPKPLILSNRLSIELEFQSYQLIQILLEEHKQKEPSRIEFSDIMIAPLERFQLIVSVVGLESDEMKNGNFTLTLEKNQALESVHFYFQKNLVQFSVQEELSFIELKNVFNQQVVSVVYLPANRIRNGLRTIEIENHQLKGLCSLLVKAEVKTISY